MFNLKFFNQDRRRMQGGKLAQGMSVFTYAIVLAQALPTQQFGV
jgi:hypothetical protein